MAMGEEVVMAVDGTTPLLRTYISLALRQKKSFPVANIAGLVISTQHSFVVRSISRYAMPSLLSFDTSAVFKIYPALLHPSTYNGKSCLSHNR